MGNSMGLGGKNRKTTKVMKITGETFKIKTPVKAGEVVKDYPGHVLLESESVKHYGVRAKPLGAEQNLEAKRLYFLVELPDVARKEIVPRRVRSGINMSAKDRLESLKLSRRSVSDLSILKPVSSSSSSLPEDGAMRLKLKLPKAEVEKLMRESNNDAEIAEKIRELCMAKQIHWNNNNNNNNGGGNQGFKAREVCLIFLSLDTDPIFMPYACS